jgi:hypothetical protein
MWNSVTVLKDMMFLYAKEPEELTLETVQILFRHGIRTPISKIPFMEFKNLETMLKHSESGYTVPEWNNGVHTQMLNEFFEVQRNNQRVNNYNKTIGWFVIRRYGVFWWSRIHGRLWNSSFIS